MVKASPPRVTTPKRATLFPNALSKSVARPPLPAALVCRRIRRLLSLRDHNRSLGRPNHERAHPDSHAVRKVRIALEHQVVSPSWFVRDANDPEIHVCLTDSVRSPAPDVVQTVLRSGTVADEQIAVHTNYVCRAILGSYRGGCEDFAGE